MATTLVTMTAYQFLALNDLNAALCLPEGCRPRGSWGSRFRGAERAQVWELDRTSRPQQAGGAPGPVSAQAGRQPHLSILVPTPPTASPVEQGELRVPNLIQTPRARVSSNLEFLSFQKGHEAYIPTIT